MSHHSSLHSVSPIRFAASRRTLAARLRLAVIVGAIALTFSACSSGFTALGRKAQRRDFTRPNSIPAPANNPSSAEKVELGRALFAEKRLSGDHTISCATCHDPQRDFQDGRASPLGIAPPAPTVAPRRTPTLWNVGEQRKFFWDGRSPSLEDQALKPIENPAEMGLPLAEAARRLGNDPAWRAAFAAAFPGERFVTPQQIGQALAVFERTLVSPEAPFDRWVRGDEAALGEPAQRGFALFTGKADCARCHSGWALTDGKLHDVGLTMAPQDRGRSRFKTPTLRELTGRAPFMHDGSLASLEAVVRHYESGGARRLGTPARFTLTAGEREDLVAFLRSLDSRSSE